MKKNALLIFVIFVSVAMTGCMEWFKGNDGKKDAQGGVYEIYVVCNQGAWDGLLGDTLRAIFLEPVQMINQQEPLFDMVYISPGGYKGLIPLCRNQIIVNVGAEYKQPSMTAMYDVTAKPQLITTITAPDFNSLTAYVWEHRADLLGIFTMAERDRAVANNKKYYNKTISADVESEFGFTMNVPQGYILRNKTKNFMWISSELPQSSLGLVIYTYPYSGKSDFEVGKLVSRRNEFSALIPGPADSSYMTTADIEPDVTYQRINGRFWAVMHGLWDVNGDYMGGPFVSFSTVDTKKNMVVVIDGYLYSPKQHKRNFMRQLENVIYTVSFPGDVPDDQQDEE